MTEFGIDHIQQEFDEATKKSRARRQPQVTRSLGDQIVRAFNRIGVGIGVAGVLALSAKAVGVNLNSDHLPTPAPYELPGPADPTAPDIACTGKASRNLILGVDGVPLTLYGLVHAKDIIRGAHLNEQKAVDAIAGLNPGVDLNRIAPAQELAVPGFCVEAKLGQ